LFAAFAAFAFQGGISHLSFDSKRKRFPVASDIERAKLSKSGLRACAHSFSSEPALSVGIGETMSAA
jgi:hypothetical protein